jgi:DNA-binding XRE family transcriptional regulator
MPRRGSRRIECRTLELDGVRYVVLRQSVFDRLCQAAGVEPALPAETPDLPAVGLEGDRASLAEKLIRRRRAAGLSQAELARRAGVRPETLNRIERGRTMPDFATVRKLVIAMNATESEHAEQTLSKSSRTESNYATRK